MKILVFTFIAAMIFLACDSRKTDSVKQAQDQNLNAAIDEKISKFLTETADARMMASEVGKLAKEKGTTPQVRQYGEWLVVENTKILRELRMLAASKNIVLPPTLSNDNADELENLREEEGEDFNNAFLKRMHKEYKGNVSEFDDAEDFKDRDVRQFATTYKPILESHLTRLEKIEDTAEAEDDKEK